MKACESIDGRRCLEIASRGPGIRFDDDDDVPARTRNARASTGFVVRLPDDKTQLRPPTRLRTARGSLRLPRSSRSASLPVAHAEHRWSTTCSFSQPFHLRSLRGRYPLRLGKFFFFACTRANRQCAPRRSISDTSVSSWNASQRWRREKKRPVCRFTSLGLCAFHDKVASILRFVFIAARFYDRSEN